MKLRFKQNNRRQDLLNYSFYSSSRQQYHATKPKQQSGLIRRLPLVLLILALLVAGYITVSRHTNSAQVVAEKTTITKPAVAAKSVVNPCQGNTLDKFILVSISQRHLWACQQGTVANDAPVITGMQKLAADLTPAGTYHIYAKQADVTLKGSDSTGSWNDPVSYWMPFLDNQYGTYGFHDATWRPEGEFGNIDPNSDKGSHGCVELPPAASKWLYDWSAVGTTLTISN
ncbi:MAG: hypothetical protein JWL89_350 [Candidatus Saccharibacteria bacterium]|nr:hypothetical protein [Candidatus Saccharibacteria bacterium]